VLSKAEEAYQGLSWLGKSNRLRLKIVKKGNGKDVLWSTYTPRFTNWESISVLQGSSRSAFPRGVGEWAFVISKD